MKSRLKIILQAAFFNVFKRMLQKICPQSWAEWQREESKHTLYWVSPAYYHERNFEYGFQKLFAFQLWMR